MRVECGELARPRRLEARLDDRLRVLPPPWLDVALRRRRRDRRFSLLRLAQLLPGLVERCRVAAFALQAFGERLRAQLPALARVEHAALLELRNERRHGIPLPRLLLGAQ